jgi:hypothetical protein
MRRSLPPEYLLLFSKHHSRMGEHILKIKTIINSFWYPPSTNQHIPKLAPFAKALFMTDMKDFSSCTKAGAVSMFCVFSRTRDSVASMNLSRSLLDTIALLEILS